VIHATKKRPPFPKAALNLAVGHIAYRDFTVCPPWLTDAVSRVALAESPERWCWLAERCSNGIQPSPVQNHFGLSTHPVYFVQNFGAAVWFFGAGLILSGAEKGTSNADLIKFVTEKPKSMTDLIKSVTDGHRKLTTKLKSATEKVSSATDLTNSMTEKLKSMTDLIKFVTDGHGKLTTNPHSVTEKGTSKPDLIKNKGFLVVGMPRCGVRTAQRAVPTFKTHGRNKLARFWLLNFSVRTVGATQA
jgi:hypothetical protein